MSRLELEILLSKLISGYLKPTAGAPEFEGWAAELDGVAEETAAEHEEMKKIGRLSSTGRQKRQPQNMKNKNMPSPTHWSYC